MTARLMEKVLERALALGVPLSAHFDLTYACNERCVHCYLYHQSPGEMSTAEVCEALEQLAEAGTLFLTFSGGEIFLRRDLFEILECARRLNFSIRLKTNGTLIDLPAVLRLKELAVQGVDISIYSHQASVHDAVTHLPGSWEQSVHAIRALSGAGVSVRISNVLLRANADEIERVREFAEALGVGYTLDPAVTPMIDGNPSVLAHRPELSKIVKVLRDPKLAPDLKPACETDDPALDSLARKVPCSAGHCFVYVDPCGRVFPCVQFPLPCGDLRQQRFAEIWNGAEPLRQIRSIRMADLPVCGTCALESLCSRCPGLAYLEGDMKGPSRGDCEKARAVHSVSAVSAGNFALTSL